MEGGNWLSADREVWWNLIAVDRKDWDSMAGSFERDLLEIAREEGAGVLEEEIGRLAGGEGRVADLGCGPGSLLPFLADRFQEVMAVDYAEELLEAARKRCGKENVTFRCHDLCRAAGLDLAVEVACCVNALIDPDRRKRSAMAATVAAALVPGGTAVIVAPALESVFHVYHTLLRCREQDGAPHGLTERGADRLLRSELDSLAGGVMRVGGVPTKYWMKEELWSFLGDHGLVPRRVRRIEYSWGEEIEEVPGWLGSPRPWDWLVVAGKPLGGEALTG